MNKIICGKFDSSISINLPTELKKIRIGSKNPNKMNKVFYTPISVSKNSILYNGEISTIRSFFIKYDNKVLNNLIVLTIKERDFILEELIDFDINLKIFEVLYPIFDDIRYISNMHKNYGKLIELLAIIRNLDLNGKSLAEYYSNYYLYKIERKLRFKNNLDVFFAFAYKGGYQEVFKLKEERNNRTIISMDFNSMYIDSMMGSFLEPKSIVYENFKNKVVNFESLNNGMYHVILKKPKNTFLKNFHPFKYVRLFESFNFNLDLDQEITILLFKNEIEYYKNFFSEIEILEGFYSKKSISHPLKNDAIKLYNERVKYKKENNQIMNNLTKFKLITIHSATNSKRFKKRWFSTKKELTKHLSSNYMINSLENNQEMIFIKKQENFKISTSNDKYLTNFINLESNETVYSLSAQIVANARLKMIRTIEKFLNYNSVEICYCNIDSIHISIISNEVNGFLNKFSNLFSENLGSLKIESIADRGYWFDIGRYWLFKDNKVVKFKNIVFNKKGNKKPFIRSRKMEYVVSSKSFKYVKTKYKSIDDSFSYNKKIDTTLINNFIFSRYNYEEINTLNVANLSVNKEILKSKKVKIDLFNEIATV